jgi:hypothetical protein
MQLVAQIRLRIHREVPDPKGCEYEVRLRRIWLLHRRGQLLQSGTSWTAGVNRTYAVAVHEHGYRFADKFQIEDA